MKSSHDDQNPMKTENSENDQLPLSAQQAFEDYPQITASEEFNRRVLERVFVAHTPSRFELFCDRMDDIFARPVLKLLGAACLGGILALAATGATIGFNKPATPGEASVSNAPLSAHVDEKLMLRSLDSRSRLAMIRGFGMPYPSSEYFEGQGLEFDAPAKCEKSIEEIDPQRSSECPAAFRSQV